MLGYLCPLLAPTICLTRKNRQMGMGMSDSLPFTPTVIDGGVSIVRLHGEACYDCGAVAKNLRTAGAVVLRGSTRVWQIVTCGCRRRAGAA